VSLNPIPTYLTASGSKRFKTGFLAGNGEEPSTFLAPRMAVEGDEVQ
jgi:hypothetical protein